MLSTEPHESPAQPHEDVIQLQVHRDSGEVSFSAQRPSSKLSVGPSNQEFGRNAPQSALSGILSRPESCFTGELGMEEEDISACYSQIKDIMLQRLENMSIHKPYLLTRVETELEAVFISAHNKIRTKPAKKDYLSGRLKVQNNHLFIVSLFDTVEDKIYNELAEGIFQVNPWEVEVEELERKIKIFHKHNQPIQLFLNRAQQKSVEKIQSEEATRFAKQMSILSKAFQLKREQEAIKLDLKIKEDISLADKRILARRREIMDKNREKVASSFEERGERKRARLQFFMEGEQRKRKVLRLSPLYLQVEREFKANQDRLYNISGRPQLEIDIFNNQRKQYHLERNKRDLILLLNPPELSRLDTSKATRSVQLNRDIFMPRGVENSMRLPLRSSFDQNSLFEGVHFSKLPKLKFSKDINTEAKDKKE